MRPKKRDQQVLEEPKSQLDQAQADHELFLQAFEKPTQIYRYLRTRNLISPVFLHRSLSYMRERCSRKANTRENFKVDDILKRVESERKKDIQEESYKSQYMNLMFTGFFDEGNDSTKSVDVETILKKVSHKKRKDATSPVTDAVIDKVSVSYNPVGSTVTTGEVVSVSSDRFQHSHGSAVRSYELLIRVTRKYFRSVVVSQPVTNGICDSDDTDVDVRPQKRRRSNRISDEDAEEEVTTSPAVRQEELTSVYTAQLVVYDQHLHRLLTDGDYEVVLQEQCDHMTTGGRSRASWETIPGHRETGPFEVFHKSPTLKFRLAWGSTALQGNVDCASLFPSSRDSHIDQLNRVNNHITTDHSTANGRRDHAASMSVERRAASGGCTTGVRDGARRKRVFYQFLYNKNTRRQTEARDNNQCPWCGIDCRQLYPLMRHLRSCHPRFNFTYAEHQKGARIDVSVNESYDGSYAGNPQDIRSYIGYAFSRNGPVRRTPVTYIFVYKPQRSSNEDMYEFADEESEASTTRQIMQGHDRLYYHPVTCQPVRPCEIEVASIDKNDPEWLRQKTIHIVSLSLLRDQIGCFMRVHCHWLLEDFTDVNEGEKEVMKMWNLHIMNHNFIGDCSLPKACATFVQEYGEAIINKNLFHNFLLHVVNLFDFGLVRPDTVTRTMMQLYWLQHRLATQPMVKSDTKLQVSGTTEPLTCSGSS